MNPPDYNLRIEINDSESLNTLPYTIDNDSKFKEIMRSWKNFSEDMNTVNSTILINSIEFFFGEDIFAKFLFMEDKIRYLYSCNNDPRIIHLKIEYLRFMISGLSSVSISNMIRVLFGDSNSKLSKHLLSLNICDIQPLLVILSSHYININWNFVRFFIPGIMGVSKTFEQDIQKNCGNLRNVSCLNSYKINSSINYSIHLTSYWILRDCIYIVLLLVYESRTRELQDSLFDFYCGLLKDLTYQKTLLLSGPKLSDFSNKDIFKKRFCITSAIPLLDILVQFLLVSTDSDDCISKILSKISSNEYTPFNIRLNSSEMIANYKDLSMIFGCLCNNLNTSVYSDKFQNFDSIIDMLLKGGEFLLVFPSPSVFKRLKRILLKQKYVDNNFNNSCEVEDKFEIQLKSHFPKVILKLSSDLSFLIFQEVLNEKHGVKGNKLMEKVSIDENVGTNFSFFSRMKKRKIPISSIISLDIGHFERPDCISLPTPNIPIPCFCCNGAKLDETSVLYRTLVIRTKKMVFKFLSLGLQDLCVKQWQVAIKQFVEYKISQIGTDHSKGMIKITKYRKNKFSFSDELLNPYIKKKRWCEDVLPNWDDHWNCNSLPISIYDVGSLNNNSLARHQNSHGAAKSSFGNYVKVVTGFVSKEDFCSWFFGSHWLNQNKSLHISGNKQKMTNIKTIPVFKGSFENFNSIDDWNSLSNWVCTLHQKFNSSHSLNSTPIVDRGIRFGVPNSQLLLDLWNAGIPVNLRNKIWQISLGNEIKVSNELFYIWYFQSITCLKGCDLKNPNITLLYRYAKEIQSIYYKNERKEEKKKISPYVVTRDRVLNISSSSFIQFILLKPCGFAREWDYSFRKNDMKKVAPLIDVDEYYIDSECILIPRMLGNVNNFEDKFPEKQLCKNENFNKISLYQNSRTESARKLDFSSLEVLSFNRFIESRGNSGISVQDNNSQIGDISVYNFSEDQYSDLNLTIVKGLLDIISALISHSPCIGYQPHIIKYIVVFLMYMEPSMAFKCILNMLSSSDFLNSNTSHSTIKTDAHTYDLHTNYLDNKNLISDFDYNSENIINKHDRFWLFISHIFQSFVYSNFPQLYQHLLYTIGINFEVVIIAWFKNIFMDTLSFPVVLIVWDNFFLLGLPFLFQAGLSLLKICESQLLRCDSILGALNILLRNCEYNSFVIKPDMFVTALREIQNTCDLKKIISIISYYNILEQKRWIMRSQQSIKNFLINRGYYCTSTSNTPR